MKKDEENNLKLTGKNEEDLKIISAYLQDSVVIASNILYLKKNRTFVMILSRFMWEDAEKGVFRKNKRIKCAVRFEDVISVQSKNINQKKNKKPLEYLAIKSRLNSDNFYKIKIFFSGGGIITVTSEVIEVFMNDIGKPWNVKHFPLHQI
mgnify:CR=1 FL=1|tara:strand:+ start:169 stop:618 length:450 start_codon:yes stop_codon:yes gene_type:complete